MPATALPPRSPGATVVAITDHAASPLIEHTDHVLLGVAGAESDFRAAAMGSRIRQPAIVDTLFIFVARGTDARSHPLPSVDEKPRPNWHCDELHCRANNRSPIGAERPAP